jgi:hypothetical protein
VRYDYPQAEDQVRKANEYIVQQERNHAAEIGTLYEAGRTWRAASRLWLFVAAAEAVAILVMVLT